MFKALVRFADLQDGNRIYEAGDTFPRLGLEVSPERIAELAGSDNRMGYPLIEAVEVPSETHNAEVDKDISPEQKSSQKTRRSRQKE